MFRGIVRIEVSLEERRQPVDRQVHDLFSKLGEKTDIVFEQQSDIRNAVAQHGDPMGTHAKRVPGVPLGVEPAVLQYRGMHHAASHDFQVACVLACRAPAADAAATLHIDFG